MDKTNEKLIEAMKTIIKSCRRGCENCILWHEMEDGDYYCEFFFNDTLPAEEWNKKLNELIKIHEEKNHE